MKLYFQEQVLATGLSVVGVLFITGVITGQTKLYHHVNTLSRLVKLVFFQAQLIHSFHHNLLQLF
jgi:hypothetical protein